MADRDDARPEFDPKHRIVGAIVLVALVVIFVPMILSGREPPPELKGTREAPPRAEVTETKMVVTPVPAEEPKPPESTEAVKVVQVPVEPKPLPMPEAKPVPPVEQPAVTKKPAPAPAKPVAVKIEDGWMVQVGTFTNLQNATRLRDKLRNLGLSVHSDSVTVSGKKAMRLRVGPYVDRAKADRAQAQIRKETGVAGVVQSPS